MSSQSTSCSRSRERYGSTTVACNGFPSAEMSMSSDHALIVHFEYGSTDLSRLFALEELIEQALARDSAGEFDGNEVAVDGSDGFLYMYGPDADRMLAAVRPVLEGADFMRGARVTLRYGPPEDGVREREVVIPA